MFAFIKKNSFLRRFYVVLVHRDTDGFCCTRDYRRVQRNLLLKTVMFMSVMVGYGSVRFVRCGVHITSRRQSPFSTTLVTHDFAPPNPNTLSPWNAPNALWMPTTFSFLMSERTYWSLFLLLLKGTDLGKFMAWYHTTEENACSRGNLLRHGT